MQCKNINSRWVGIFMQKIRKAVIPAAGYGTRFLPATKATPKEMLPIVDKPTIQYIVEEAVASGIGISSSRRPNPMKSRKNEAAMSTITVHRHHADSGNI